MKKVYLEGREHITSKTKSRKNLSDDPQSKNLTNEYAENQEQTDFENQQEEKEKK